MKGKGSSLNENKKIRTELFKRLMTPINANRIPNIKMANCGHVSLRLNDILSNTI